MDEKPDSQAQGVHHILKSFLITEFSIILKYLIIN